MIFNLKNTGQNATLFPGLSLSAKSVFLLFSQFFLKIERARDKFGQRIQFFICCTFGVQLKLARRIHK
jgi:hypothetical protein